MPVQEMTPTKIKTMQRDSIRWTMVIYDTLIFIACWWIVFVLQPSVSSPIAIESSVVYLVIGCVIYFVLRLLRASYKQIWRLGAPQAFSRELQATVIASALFVPIGILLGKNSELGNLPAISWLAFSGVYVISCVAVRFAYYHLYVRATRNTPFGRFMRRMLRMLALVDFDSKKPGAVLPLGFHSAAPVTSPINELQNIINQFAIHGNVTQITQINKGYINRTYYVETLSERGHVHKYTLQRINTNVFPDVDALMDNFKLTTEHLYGRLQLPGYHYRGSVQNLRTTTDGKPYLRDDSGCWRMVTYFDNVFSLDIPDSPETFYHAGSAFGRFMREMSDVDIEKVKVVIPNFHNTLSRYQDLEKAIAADPRGRVSQVLPEIEFIRARADRYGMISQALESGEIPTRICHNDCNLNNILFDSDTHLPVAIIDLDTVMPSSPLYDFGDSIRIGANTATDDEKDLAKVSCDLNLYEKYARGYLAACGDILTKKELELLPYAALIITSEDGIRFLMDHINGDTYYNIYYPGQNLDRARTQLKLVEDMEKKLPEIKEILQKIYAELGLEA